MSRIRRDKTTQAVVDMYNQYPYPLSGTHGGFFSTWVLPVIRQSGKDFHRILEAGCGTGNVAIEIARAFPKAEVVAIDIGDKSLSLAREQVVDKKVVNVSILKSNLMEHDSRLGVFDFIHCQGVVHHLSSPAQGLKHLNAYLKDEGLAYIWLYMALGRRFITETREILSLLGSDSSSYEDKLKLLELVNQNFHFLGSKGRLSRNPAAEIVKKDGCDSRLLALSVNALKYLQAHGWMLFLKGIVQRTIKRPKRKNCSPKGDSFFRKVGLVDTYLHANDVFFRFAEAFDLLTNTGFSLDRIVQGMSNSLEECFGPDNPITACASCLSPEERYTLIELCERPSGVGFLCTKKSMADPAQGS